MLRDTALQGKHAKYVVPHFSCVDALNKNVFCIIFLLKARIASRGSVLEAMLRSAIRGPDAVLNCQPDENFALEEGPALPYASGVGYPLNTETEPEEGGSRTASRTERGEA